MAFASIGDLASNLLLAQASAGAKRRFVSLSTELTTGLASDVRARLRNDLTKQVDWEHGIAKNQALQKTLTEAMTKVDAKQAVLKAIGETAVSFANNVEIAVNGNASTFTNALALEARVGLEQILSQLNTQTMGQSIFAGTSGDKPVMASAEEILSSIRAHLGVAQSATSVVQGVRDWMDDPVNGYQSVAFLGSHDPSSPIRLTNDREIVEASNANSPSLKEMVENFVLATLAEDENLITSRDQRARLLKISANKMRTSNSKLIELQSNLGFVEAALTRAKVTSGAEIHAYEKLRVETLGIDEFEVANKLQQTELQLEKIYALTARSARMSLLEYLR